MSVAPHTGAWIETSYLFGEGVAALVAPHTGAWIETVDSFNNVLTVSRRPSHRGVD